MRFAIIVLMIATGHTALCESQPSIRFRVGVEGDVSCGRGQSLVRGHEPWWVEVPLQISIKNIKDKSAVTGEVSVINERIYHRSTDAKLVLFRTTSAPDEFGTSFLPGDGYPDIVDKELSPGSEKVIEIKKHVYLVDGDTQDNSGSHQLIVSFHVTNLHHDGNGESYWSDPVTVALPKQCGPPER